MRKTQEVLDLQPPADEQTERALLGSIFTKPDVLDDVIPMVSKADFYNESHALIYGAMLEMYGDGGRIDQTLFAAHAKKYRVDGLSLWEKIGGAAFLVDVLTASPTAMYAKHYAGIVRGLALKRSLKTAGERILQLGQDEFSDITESLDSAEGLVLAIRDRHATIASRSSSVADLLQDALVALSSRSSGNSRPGLSTGFAELDPLMGFRRGELLILAARPSMGKTALALNLASGAAAAGSPVMFFSLEMNSLTVADRLLSSWSQVPATRLEAATLTQDERRLVIEASANLSQVQLTIDDSPRLSIQDIAAICRRQRRRHGLSLVVIDYLQLIAPENPRDPREQQVARISARLKGLARELEVPVLCLAQLNRQIDTSADKRPRLSHLRESGAIEQDADVVAFVHRPEYFAAPGDKEELKGRAEVFVEKNRNGRTGEAKLTWVADTVTFRTASSRDIAEQCSNYDPTLDNFNNG